jgi:hypothetical protein
LELNQLIFCMSTRFLSTWISLLGARLVFFPVVVGSVLVGQALTSQEQASQAPQKRDRVSFPTSQAERRFLHTKTQVGRKYRQPITLQLHALSLADAAAAYQTIMGCTRRAWFGRMQASKRGLDFFLPGLSLLAESFLQCLQAEHIV